MQSDELNQTSTHIDENDAKQKVLENSNNNISSYPKAPKIWPSICTIIIPVFLYYLVPSLLKSKSETLLSKFENYSLSMIMDSYGSILSMIITRTTIVVLITSLIYILIMGFSKSNRIKKVLFYIAALILVFIICSNLSPDWNIDSLNPKTAFEDIFSSIYHWFALQLTFFSVLYVILKWTISPKMANLVISFYFMIVSIVMNITLFMFTFTIGLFPVLGDALSTLINIVGSLSMQALLGSYLVILDALATIMQSIIIKFYNFKKK